MVHSENTSSLRLRLLPPVVKSRLLRLAWENGHSKPVLDRSGPTESVPRKCKRSVVISAGQPSTLPIEPLINPRQGFQPQLPPVKLWGGIPRVQAQRPRRPCLLPDHAARGATCTGHAGREQAG